jgi:hypothetical protein
MLRNGRVSDAAFNLLAKLGPQRDIYGPNITMLVFSLQGRSVSEPTEPILKVEKPPNTKFGLG